jgi:hypothetical protein
MDETCTVTGLCYNCILMMGEECALLVAGNVYDWSLKMENDPCVSTMYSWNILIMFSVSIMKSIIELFSWKICCIWSLEPTATSTSRFLTHHCTGKLLLNLDSFLLSDELPQNIIPSSFREWNEANYFETWVSLLLICNKVVIVWYAPISLFPRIEIISPI